MTVLDGDQLDTLAASFGGTLVLPSDTGYETARQVHNGPDRPPAGADPRCSGTADVAAAIWFGRQTGPA
jgi:hypothetical protein